MTRYRFTVRLQPRGGLRKQNFDATDVDAASRLLQQALPAKLPAGIGWDTVRLEERLAPGVWRSVCLRCSGSGSIIDGPANRFCPLCRGSGEGN